MTLNVVTLVVAVMLQVCLKDSVADVGTPCPTGNECNAETEFCDTTPATCACNVLHAAPTGSQVCTAKTCNTDGECGSETNAVCNSDKNCECGTTFKLDLSSGNCIEKVIGDTCTENEGECANIDNAYCINGKCDCGPLYTQSGASCTKKTCTASDDTTPCDAIENAECSEDNSECMCASGYQENTQTGQCTRSSENGASRLKITGLLLLVLTVVYLY